jgi:hypothetical protein
MTASGRGQVIRIFFLLMGGFPGIAIVVELDADLAAIHAAMKAP